MAKLVNTTITQSIAANMTTYFADGSQTKTTLKIGDMVEGLRWTENEELHSVTGKISAINYYITRVSKVNLRKPVNYLPKDLRLLSIIVDASTEFESNVVRVPANEIVEFEGVENVTSVFVTPNAIVDLEMEYTDGTTDSQSLEIGDTLENVTIMTYPGKPDIVGDFKIEAWDYKLPSTEVTNRVDITGIYLSPINDKYNENVLAKFDSLLGFAEIPTVEISNPKSLAAIATALQEMDEVAVSLSVDVEIPKRDDGRITTVMIGPGKTVDLDLNGKSITCEAYAFYVNGGTLNITDEAGDGTIICKHPNDAYMAVMVLSGGTCNMYSGTIDTTHVDKSTGADNWLYGVVCSGDGIFNMYGGTIRTDGASGISITNGTASGEGAKFTIAGDAVIESEDCASVYLADNKSVTIKDDARLYGGIVARMGDITVEGNARVEATKDPAHVYPLGEQVVLSGVGGCAAGILALTGVYGSSLGNNLNIVVSDNARVISTLGKAIEIAEINTKFDQVVNVNVAKNNNLRDSYRVYNHNALAELAAECGKTLAAETNTTDLTISIDGEIVYPVVEDDVVEEG